MFVITVDFEIKSEFVNEFRNRVLQQAKDSLNNEKQCFIFDVCFDEKNTNKVFLYEIYQDKDAFDYHLKSDHYLSFDKDVKNWVTKKIVNQLIKQN
ncbi:MAG: antibiotic biosynthesis monooxygenase [Alphaproteobacteria bacterium]|nr:MAG: antibiotic biosynthesis monooxygenase [Alphaproteobacteria bacterium]